MVNITVLGSMGYHTAETVKGTMFESPGGSNAHQLANVVNICSYIPIIGAMIAYARLVAVHHNRSSWPLGVQAFQVIRGVCEILGCGLLFLIPDLIVSIGRHLCPCASCRTI